MKRPPISYQTYKKLLNDIRSYYRMKMILNGKEKL